MTPRTIGIATLLTACSPEYGLVSTGDPAGADPAALVVADTPSAATPAAADARDGAAPEAEPTFVPVAADRARGSAVTVEEAPGLRRETFEIGEGAKTPLVDFLFVVDNSASMAPRVATLQRAFADLAREGVFPDGARVAVTSTIPANFEAPRRAHPATAHTGELPQDPGFQALVDASRITRARSFSPEHAEAFALDGCSAWFGPTETNHQGVPCLVAHTQSRLQAVRVEAGATALAQLLEREAGRGLFRPGAAVNVVFVSDTHDPGFAAEAPGFDELVAARPDLAALRAAVQRHPVASFRVHAIAPASNCGEDWGHIGPIYHDLAAASGGQSLDLCVVDDFRPLIRRIADEGAVMQEPRLVLSRPTDGDARVAVDGVEVPWTLDGDRVLTLEALDGAGPARRATVTYVVPGGTHAPTRGTWPPTRGAGRAPTSPERALPVR